MGFKRAAVGTSRTLDEVARIRVYVSRADAATKGKENVTRSLVVEEATVSAVADAIERALFGEPVTNRKK